VRAARALDDHHLEQGSQRAEVVAVAGVERQFGRERRGGNEQVDCSCSACLAPSGDNGGEDPSIGSCSLIVEGQRIEGGFGSLEAILSTATLPGIVGGVRSRRKFRQSHGADRDRDREPVRVDLVEVDDHRRVQDAALVAHSLSHEARRPGPPSRRGQRGSAWSRREVRS